MPLLLIYVSYYKRLSNTARMNVWPLPKLHASSKLFIFDSLSEAKTITR